MFRSLIRPRPAAAVVAGAASLALLAACAGAPQATTPSPSAAANYPVTLTNCGTEITVTAQPKAGLTMNQGATEVVLALGLQDQLTGTAYLDDAIPERWQAAYQAIPVLSAKYPDLETINKANPDFIYASYGSAFDDKAAGPRDTWAARNVATYVSPFGCGAGIPKPPMAFESVWGELDDVATILGHPDAAIALRAEQKKQLDALAAQAPGKGKSIFWFDSGTDTAYAGTGQGGPQLVIDAVGATNVFADVEGAWADLSWEKVVAADPDVIVLADASWSTAADKIAYLKGDPVLKQLRAVQNESFAVIPFAAGTPGVRLADGAVSLGEQLTKLP